MEPIGILCVGGTFYDLGLKFINFDTFFIHPVKIWYRQCGILKITWHIYCCFTKSQKWIKERWSLKMKSFVVGTSTFKVFPYFQGNASMTFQLNYLLFNFKTFMRRKYRYISTNYFYRHRCLSIHQEEWEEEIIRKLWEWKEAIPMDRNAPPSNLKLRNITEQLVCPASSSCFLSYLPNWCPIRNVFLTFC